MNPEERTGLSRPSRTRPRQVAIDAANRLVMTLCARKRYVHFRRIEAVPSLPREEIARIQLDKLRRLLASAQSDVPYYRRLFNEIGFESDSVSSVAQLHDLPVLTKPIIREHFEELVSSKFDRNALLRFSTGGSTGEPVDFYKDVDYYELEMAYLWRSWSWAGWRPGDLMVWIWGAPQETGQLRSVSGRIKWRLGGKMLLDAFDMGDAKMMRWVDQINAFGAEHVIGYATSLAYFAQFLMNKGIELKPKFKQVISTAEKLRPEQREIIEKAFKTNVRDQYGCREIRLIAFECPAGDMHISTDACVVEFVEDPKVPVEVYKMLVTCLDNHAMPLIRYDVGDYGAPAEASVPCEINYPIMRMDIGRTSDNFIMPSGRVVHGEYFTHLMYGVEGIRKFQFYQDRSRAVHLYIVLSDPSARRLVEKETDRVIRESLALDPDLKIDVQYLDEIPATRTGKHRFTISEFA